MVCTSVGQMLGIARNTFKKMEAAGYEAECYDPDTYKVSYTKADGEKISYLVTLTEPKHCPCNFFAENHPVFAEQTVCKHLLFAEAQKAEDEAADESEIENYEREQQEAEMRRAMAREEEMERLEKHRFNADPFH